MELFSKAERETVVREGVEYMSSIIQALEASGKCDEALLAYGFYHLHRAQDKLLEAIEKTE